MNILLKSGRIIEYVSDEDILAFQNNLKYCTPQWQSFVDNDGKVILILNTSEIECIYDNSIYSIDSKFTTNTSTN